MKCNHVSVNDAGVRPPRADELVALQQVEVRADEVFAAGMTEPGIMDLADLEAGLERNNLWIAVDPGNHPIGFALVFPLGGRIHLEQLSVVPEHMGRGWGTRLVNVVCSHAVQVGAGAVTLSTYANVSWNASFYRKRGFRVLAEVELDTPLLALREHEREIGLDVTSRVFMLWEPSET